MATSKVRRVLILGYERANVLDIVGPLEMMSAVGRDKGPCAYAIELIAGREGPFTTTSGLPLLASRGFADIPDRELEDIDTLIVAGGNGHRDELENSSLVDFIKRGAQRVRRVASVCSGSILLGKAGLLEGRCATTHWSVCADLRRMCPNTIVHEDAIFVRDGEIWTSAGITTGMDLALAMIEDDLGREAALEVARETVMFMMRPGGQSQFSETLISQAHDKGRLGPLIAWIRENLDEDLSVPSLAERAHMTERTLARAFQTEIGETPAKYVECMRIDQARRALSGTDRSAEVIAAQCGFGSLERMRRAFKKYLGVSPSDFRARFQSSHSRTHVYDQSRHINL